MSRTPRKRTTRAATRAGEGERTRTSALSRRRFISLLAAGSASALLAPARRVVGATAPATKPAAKPAASGPSARVRAEIEKQKKSTAGQLQVIRNYVLPAGSPMAFEFRPLRKSRK